MLFVCRHTHTYNIQYLILFHGYNGYLNTPKCYVIVNCLSCFELPLVTDVWTSILLGWIIATVYHRTVECCLNEKYLGIGVQSEVYEANSLAARRRLQEWKRILLFLNFSVKLVNKNAYWCWSGNLNRQDHEASLGLIVMYL